MDKGCKESSPPHNLGRNRVNTYAVRISMLIADIEDDIMDPVMWQSAPASDYSNRNALIDSQAVNKSSYDLSMRLCQNIRGSDDYLSNEDGNLVFEPASNKLLIEAGKLIYICVRRSYALSWKPCQGDSLNLPDHRIHKDGDGDASFQLKSDSLPHAHAQTTKTYYKHQDSRIMRAQELKTKTSAQTLIYKIFLQRYKVYQGRLLASFQDDAKYEHVGQDTRSQGGKDDQDGRIKI
ncbi:hypothetical protein Tco_0532553 [Tanacetum coccineum]